MSTKEEFLEAINEAEDCEANTAAFGPDEDDPEIEVIWQWQKDGLKKRAALRLNTKTEEIKYILVSYKVESQ